MTQDQIPLALLESLPDPPVVVDVGVADGTPWLYRRWSTAALHLIDPISPTQALRDLLADRAFVFHQVALGSRSGSAEMTVDHDQPSRSSLLDRTPLTATDHRTERRRVETTTIDDLTTGNPALVDAEIGLKIDAEGAEFDILRGARQTLKRCSFVICEVSVLQRFVGSAGMDEVIMLMRMAGFGLHSILHTASRGDGIITHADLAFVRR